MKRTNKYLSLALAIIMALSLCVTSFAADIAVANPAEGETYNAYKIFDYTKSGENFAYTMAANSEWKTDVFAYTFDHDNDNKTAEVPAFTYEVSATDKNVLVVTVHEDFETAEHAADLADYLRTKLTGKTVTKKADAKGKFEGLAVGYYFVDTTLGSLCSLVMTEASHTLYEKNAIPTMTKEVKEDNGNWGPTATADKGQVVDFRLTVKTGTAKNLGTGVDGNYVITDTIENGMSFVESTFAIDGWNKGTDYTVAINGKVATITLMAEKLDDLAENATIVINYSATLDANATVAGTGNVNKATLKYKEQTTTEVSATVYTYEFNVFKHTGADSNHETGKGLGGAKFVLKNSDKSKFAVATLNNGVYTITGWTDSRVEIKDDETTTEVNEAKVAATVFESPTDGKFNIEGLDVDTYYLEEIEAPAGYNLLAEDKKIELADTNTNTWIPVLNQSGALLPSTGGVGTTMFYVLGSVMMIGAAILLVTKKKMANEQ